MNTKKIATILFTLVISASLLFSLAGCKEAQTTTVTNTTIKTTTQVNTISDTSTVTETITETNTATSTLTETLTDTKTVTQEPATRTIVDQLGRTVEIPTTINKVLCTGAAESMLVYMLAPDKLGGWNSLPSGNYYDQSYADLPVVGRWDGGGVTANYETFIAMEPDIIICNNSSTIDEMQTNFGSIPLVYTSTYDFDTTVEAIQFMGNILGAEGQAQKLIDYFNGALNYVESVVSGIPEENRVTVYYAEGKDGLSTDPAESWHTQPISFCGGLNVADVQNLVASGGMTAVTIEQLLEWNPDVIIIGRGSTETIYNTITSDANWATIQAVKDGKVYVRPSDPFSWLDGPPGVNEIVGIYWLVQTLYPTYTTDLDLKAKVLEFYSDFYHYNLTDAEYDELTTNALSTN